VKAVFQHKSTDERTTDFPVRHSEFSGYSENNGGLENTRSVERDTEGGASSLSDSNLLIEPLPPGWTNNHFGEICGRVKESYQPVDGGDTPYVGLEHLAQGFPAFVGRGKESDVKSSKTAFKIGDILYGKLRPYLRKGAQADFDGVCSTDILAFRAKVTCESEFLKFVIHSDEFVAHAKSTTSGVQHPRTSWPSLREFRLSLPPLPEQKKIAHILSTVKRAIEAQERIIQITTELKKALMHQLFTEGLRNEPQKQTEIGLVPESWEICRVGDVAKIQSGGTPSRDIPENWVGGNIPWVKTGEINYCLINDTEEKITPTGLANSSARLFPAGTLLMAMYGQGITRGKVGLLGIEAATNQACASIIPNEKFQISSVFLYYFFEHHYENLRLLGHGANQRNMNAALIRSFPLAYPKIDVQNSMLTALKSIDEKRVFCSHKKSQLQDLFRTLLHELMTAKIRVHNIEIQ
jgi:type I restriction enzyme, S subunit